MGLSTLDGHFHTFLYFRIFLGYRDIMGYHTNQHSPPVIKRRRGLPENPPFIDVFFPLKAPISAGIVRQTTFDEQRTAQPLVP